LGGCVEAAHGENPLEWACGHVRTHRIGELATGTESERARGAAQTDLDELSLALKLEFTEGSYETVGAKENMVVLDGSKMYDDMSGGGGAMDLSSFADAEYADSADNAEDGVGITF